MHIKDCYTIPHAVLKQTRNKTLKIIYSMKTIIVLATLLAAALAIPADTYNPKYDSFDAEAFTGNIRLMNNYGKCFLDKGPCTAEAGDFKRMIPEALRTECGKCTPKQRQLVRTVVRAYQTKLPDVWTEIKNKEDPEGKYTESFENFLNASN